MQREITDLSKARKTKWTETMTTTTTTTAKTINEVGIDDLYGASGGILTIDEAKHIHQIIKQAISKAKRSRLSATEVWKEVVDKKVLKPNHPHSLHQLVYYSVYANWDTSINGPPLYWFPSL